MRRTTCLLGLTLIAMLGALSLPSAAPQGRVRGGDDDGDELPARRGPIGPGPVVVKGRPAPPVKIPLTVAPKDIESAIERGVAYLKSQQNDDGGWYFAADGTVVAQRMNSPGVTALIGLTLLHCGVAAKDPTVQKCARFVRASFQTWVGLPAVYDPRLVKVQIPVTRANVVYSVSSAILFLERLGERRDLALIRSLSFALMGRQVPQTGGWGYSDLRQGMMTNRVLILENPKFPDAPYTDNSNTQFALLALWAAHRHGIRITAPLANSAARFNRSQNPDGGWPYIEMKSATKSTISMAGVGLLALAMRHAAANADVLKPRAGKGEGADAPRRALAKVDQDDHIIQGFQFLRKKLDAVPSEWPTKQECYSLWSLERAAVAFDLRTIGGVDWFQTGAAFLIYKQRKDGSWDGNYGLAETCFALLFLHKTNLLPEVTPLLKGMVKDDGPDPLSPDVRKPPVELKKDPGSDLSTSLTPLGSRRPSLETKIQPKRVAPAPPTAIEKQHHQTQVDKLLTKMKASSDFGKDLLIKHWRDGEDPYYTPALAKAIPMLSGTLRRKAQAALADHCTRLTPAERDEHLHADDAEIRRAAVLSCAVRDDKSHIARSIELLQDKELLVAVAAHEVLCSLTGKDFGPSTDASATERVRAVAAWKGWYEKQGSK